MSWRTLLSLPARRARGVSLLYATRNYSLLSNKIQAVVHEHKKTLEKDRVNASLSLAHPLSPSPPLSTDTLPLTFLRERR